MSCMIDPQSNRLVHTTIEPNIPWKTRALPDCNWQPMKIIVVRPSTLNNLFIPFTNLSNYALNLINCFRQFEHIHLHVSKRFIYQYMNNMQHWKLIFILPCTNTHLDILMVISKGCYTLKKHMLIYLEFLWDWKLVYVHDFQRSSYWTINYFLFRVMIYHISS